MPGDSTQSKSPDLQSVEDCFGLMRQINVAMFICDTQWKIQFWNEAAKSFFGIEEKQVLGNPIHSMLNIYEPRTGYSDIRKALERNAAWASEVQSGVKDKKKKWARWTVSRIKLSKENNEHILFVAADITRCKEAELNFKESETKFRNLLDNSVDCIMRFDRDFRHLYVNKIVEDQTGIPPAAFIGKTHSEMGFPEHLVQTWEDALRVVFKTKKPHRIEFELPSGVWIDWLCIPEQDPKKKVESILTAARDVTQRKQGEEALRKARNDLEEKIHSRTADLEEANRRLTKEVLERRELEDKLVAKATEVEMLNDILSHDVNNINQTAMAYLNLVLDPDSGPLSEEQRQYIESSKKQIIRCSNLIDKIRTYAILKSTKSEAQVPMDLITIIRDSIEMAKSVSSRKKLEVNFPHKQKMTILADHLIPQLFFNLFENSVKHGEKEIVKLSVEIKESELDGRLNWIVKIQDDGPGIPKGMKQELFSKYNKIQTGKGTGVGLAIVKSLTEKYGGKVWLEEPPAEKTGALFCVALPKG